MDCFVKENSLHIFYGQQELVFGDTIKKGGKKYRLFHGKTTVRPLCDGFEITTSAKNETGVSIPGLSPVYKIKLCKERKAFYFSVSLNTDTIIRECDLDLFRMNIASFRPEKYTGYEYDVDGKPFSLTFDMPPLSENDVDSSSLEKMTPHLAWEKMKTRPKTFSKGMSFEDKKNCISVYGGTPKFSPEAGVVSVFSCQCDYKNDLRLYSGENSLGAWFFFDNNIDFFKKCEELDKIRPKLDRHENIASEPQKVILQSGLLKAVLLKSNSGMWIRSVGNFEKNLQEMPLFDFTLFDSETGRFFDRDSGEGFSKVDIFEKENYMRITFSGAENGFIPEISIIEEVFLLPDISRISWKTRVINTSDRWAVCRISYPSLLSGGHKTVYTTVAPGNVDRHFTEKNMVFKARHPIGVRTPMAFTALYDEKEICDLKSTDNGLYIGIHDREGCLKNITLSGVENGDISYFNAWYKPSYEKRPGNSYTLAGETVWQSFSGDWFDAADIYGDFVKNKAEWFPHIKGRPDSPEWMKHSPVWLCHDMPNSNPDSPPFPITLRAENQDKTNKEWYEKAVEFSKKIGIPVAYHLYNWHWVPFNNDNPNYFPTQSELKTGIKALKSANIRIVPYIAGYSWDMHDFRGENYRFESEGKPSSAKDSNGNVVSKSYAALEPDGTPVKFARMCPSTAVWKNEVCKICKKLWSDFGADGVYIDVISAQYDGCCDETHSHEPGYGSFWHRCYADLVANIRIDAPKDFAIVSESVSEVYTETFDGFLGWTWVQPGSVPAFMRIYSGYTQVFGRVYTKNKRNDADYFRFNTAQAFVFGQQLGWMHPEIVDDKEQFEFLKKIATLRYTESEFFEKATMLRPPFVEGGKKLDCEAFLRCCEYNHEKCVVSGCFESGDTVKLFVVNSSKEKASVNLSFLTQEYMWNNSYSAEGDMKISNVKAKGNASVLSLELEGEGVGVIKWKRVDKNG